MSDESEKKPERRGKRSVPEYRYIQSLAHGAVTKAIKSGLMLAAKEHSCVDCGRTAAHYDHGDYSKPLEVVPVCASCNCKRGPSDVWPGIEKSLAYLEKQSIL